MWYDLCMNTSSVIQRLINIVRPKILKEFTVDSCIVSTAICIDVLKKYGILAEPLVVKTMIFNQPFVARLERTGVFPNSEQEIAEWTVADGSYSVGIGFGPPQSGKWAGHLVAIAEREYLIDISVDQACRPFYGMIFNPITVRINEEFLAGKSCIVFNYNGCVFRYDAFPNNLSFQLSPDWTLQNRRQNIVQSIFSEMELK